MAGSEAYEAGDYARCADVLLAVEASGVPVAIGGELLAAECLSRAGRFEEALAYLRRQLPAGRVPPQELRESSRPGLEALRAQPGWQALLPEVEELEAQRVARIDAPLREQLLRRAARDQEARAAALDKQGDSAADEAWRTVAAVDADNTRWLGQIIAETGWPDSDLVGRDGARAAWMIAQHAGHDPAFQASVLPLLEAAVAKGSAAPQDLALLTDRVLVAQGKRQRYGTQFHTGDDGMMRMRPAEDEAGLDARRRSAGLPPMDDYRKMMAETYGRPVE
nr:DUF6624 domain-containing protein [Luteimonas saliphila]